LALLFNGKERSNPFQNESGGMEMSQSHKKIALILSSFIVAGLLLTGAVVALAATSFSLVGTLVFTDPVYSVNSQTFTVTETTLCTYLDGSTADPCSGLAGKMVEATGIYTSTAYTATAITELGSATGVLTDITGDVWTVGGIQYQVSAELALGFAVRDVVMLTYKNVSGTFVAVDVESVETFTTVGKVIAIGGTWQVNGETFTVNSDTMVYDGAKVKDIVEVTYYGDNIAVDIAPYPTTTVNARALQVPPDAWVIEGIDGLTTNEWTDDYEGAVAGDIVTIVYYEYEGVLIASEITLYAPIKNVNSRCEDWQTADLKIPPGIENLLPEDVNLAQVYAMFCQGFGWGEIKKAFKLTAVNPEDLLARKAKGEGWGQIKKDFDLKPAHENNGKGHSNDVTSTTGKPVETGKPDKPDKQNKPENSNKPENPGNSDHSKENNGKANGKNK